MLERERERESVILHNQTSCFVGERKRRRRRKRKRKRRRKERKRWEIDSKRKR